MCVCVCVFVWMGKGDISRTVCFKKNEQWYQKRRLKNAFRDFKRFIYSSLEDYRDINISLRKFCNVEVK